MNEDTVRGWLSQKSMTAEMIFGEVKRHLGKTNLTLAEEDTSRAQIRAFIARIMKNINPSKKSINGKMFYSIKH